MKKFSVILLVIAMSICFAAEAFAAEVNTNAVSIVYDHQILPYKEFCPQKLGQSMTRAEGPTDGSWVATIEVNRAVSDSYWDQAHSTRWPIDLISAYYRAYRGDELYYSAIDTQENASHAAAGYDHVAADEIIGQHNFEEEGYQSWQVETYY